LKDKILRPRPGIPGFEPGAFNVAYDYDALTPYVSKSAGV